MRFSLCRTFIISALFLFLVNHANAVLILNHPNYTGLNTGLVGYWSFDAKDISGTKAYDRSSAKNTPVYTALATDNFNRADQNPLAGNWFNSGTVKLASNAVAPVSVGGDSGSYWSAITNWYRD